MKHYPSADSMINYANITTCRHYAYVRYYRYLRQSVNIVIFLCIFFLVFCTFPTRAQRLYEQKILLHVQNLSHKIEHLIVICICTLAGNLVTCVLTEIINYKSNATDKTRQACPCQWCEQIGNKSRLFSVVLDAFQDWTKQFQNFM